jgi:hypothetical protein
MFKTASKSLAFVYQMKQHVYSEFAYIERLQSMVYEQKSIYVIIDLDFASYSNTNPQIRKIFFEASKLFIKGGFKVIGLSSEQTNNQFKKINSKHLTKLHLKATIESKGEIVKKYLCDSDLKNMVNFIIFGDCSLFTSIVDHVSENTIFVDLSDDMQDEAPINNENESENYSMVEFILLYVASTQILNPSYGIDFFLKKNQPTNQQLASLNLKPATKSLLFLNKMTNIIQSNFVQFEQLYTMSQTKEDLIVYVDFDQLKGIKSCKNVQKRFFEASNMLLRTRVKVFGLTCDESDKLKYVSNKQLTGLHRGKRIDLEKKEEIITNQLLKRDNKDSKFIIFGGSDLINNLFQLAVIHKESLLIDVTSDNATYLLNQESSNENSMVEYILLYLATIRIMTPNCFEKLRTF